MALTFHTYKLLEKFDDDINGFGEVLSLGQINNLINKDDFKKLSVAEFKDQYSNKLLLENFNIKSINSLDYSNFEGADIIHDLNLPIKDVSKQFDTIIDFGTSEHIFNIIQNFKNISSLCKIGGKILHCLPANNNCGHGFWQFSPELFFQLYQRNNGYSDTEIYLLNLHDKKNFYKIKIQEKGTRLELNSKEPLYMFIKTKKIGDSKFDNINQSDYVNQWSTLSNKTQKTKNKLSKFNKKIKDGIKNILKNNFFLKDVYTNLENTKIHNKNNFKINKNLEKLEF